MVLGGWSGRLLGEDQEGEGGSLMYLEGRVLRAEHTARAKALRQACQECSIIPALAHQSLDRLSCF